jgi:protein-S-isoprenylcysteine O-methyltransferase Ste14
MALIEELEKSGNWLFRWRSFLPLVVFAVAIPLVLFKDSCCMQPAVGSAYWWGSCLAVSFLGQIIRALTIGFTPRGTSGRNTAEGQVAETLNTRGIYGMVRHPLYLGNFFMWMGIVLFTGNWWFSAAVALAFWLYYERIMFAEEAFLRRKFGEAYLTWSESTPAFLPRLSGWTAPGVRFSMRNVLKREYNGFFAMFLSFAIMDWAQAARLYGFQWNARSLSLHWQYMLAGAFVIFIVLRSLKKYTRVLDVEGREYL